MDTAVLPPRQDDTLDIDIQSVETLFKRKPRVSRLSLQVTV